MERGTPVYVMVNGRTRTAKYEFRIVDGEPLGHHSVYMDDGSGRRVVCGCELRLPCNCGASLEPDYTNGDHDDGCPAKA